MKNVVALIEEQFKKEPFNRELILTLGESYLESKRYKDAVKVYSNLIYVSKNDFIESVLKFSELNEHDLNNEDLNLALIALHNKEGLYKDALFEIETLLETKPNDQGLINQVINIAHKHDNKGDLIPVLEKVILMNSKNIRLYELLAGSYLSVGKRDSAVHLYEKAIQIIPNSISLLNYLGDLYYENGEHKKAAEIYSRILDQGGDVNTIQLKLEKSVDKKVDQKEYYLLLAKIYQRNLRPDEAINTYRSFFEAFPAEGSRVVKQLKGFLDIYPNFPEAKFLRARLLIHEQNYTEAIYELNNTLKVFPKYIDRVIDILKEIIVAYPGQVLAYQSLADAYSIKGDHRGAMKYYLQLLEKAPDEATAVINRCKVLTKELPDAEILVKEVVAKAFFAKKQYRKAIAIIDDLIGMEQASAEGYYIQGISYNELAQTEKAIKCFQEAIKRSPENIDIHQRYQDVVYAKLDNVIADLNKLSQKDPHKYSLYYLLGKSYFQKNELNSAISFLQMSLKDALKERGSHKLLGFSYKEVGRFDLAVEQFDKAFYNTDENNIEEQKKILLYTGLSYEAMGEKEKAIEKYEEIMMQDVNYENIKIRIEKLRNSSWVELGGKALISVVANMEAKDIIVSWGKNNQAVEKNKLQKKENINLPFSLEHNNIGVSLALAGRERDALDEFLLSQQFDENFAVVSNNLAVLAIKDKDLDLAENYLTKCLSQNDQIAIAHANYGTLCYLRKEYQKALTYYRKSMAIDDNMFLIHINIGDLQYLLGDARNAVLSWQKALNYGVLPELAKRRLMFRSAEL